MRPGDVAGIVWERASVDALHARAAMEDLERRFGRDLAGWVAIVTHAATPAGRAVAKRLAAAGAWVVVHFDAAYDAARRLVDEIRSAGGRALLIHADLSDPAQLWELTERTAMEWGQIDMLVHIVGGDGPTVRRTDRYAPAPRTPAAIASDLVAYVRPEMQARGRGGVVFVVNEPSPELEALAAELAATASESGVLVTTLRWPDSEEPQRAHMAL